MDSYCCFLKTAYVGENENTKSGCIVAALYQESKDECTDRQLHRYIYSLVKCMCLRIGDTSEITYRDLAVNS